MNNTNLFEDLESSLEELSQCSIIFTSPFSKISEESGNDSFSDTICSVRKIDYSLMSDEMKEKNEESKKLIDKMYENEIKDKISQLKLNILGDIITRENSPLSDKLEKKIALHFNIRLLKKDKQESCKFLKSLGIDENMSLAPITDNEKKLLDQLFIQEIKRKYNFTLNSRLMNNITEKSYEPVKAGCMIPDNQESLLEVTANLHDKLVAYNNSNEQSIKLLNNMLFLNMRKYDEYFTNDLKFVDEKCGILNEQAKNVKNTLVHEIARTNDNIGAAVNKLLKVHMKESKNLKHTLNKLLKKKAEYDNQKGTEFYDMFEEYSRILQYMEQHAKLVNVLKK